MKRTTTKLLTVISIWLNCVLLTTHVYRISKSIGEEEEGGEKGELCALISNSNSKSKFISVSGLASGLPRGSQNTTLRDVLVTIPARRYGDLSALWDAWGEEFWKHNSLEIFTFDDSPSTVDTPSDKPVAIETREIVPGKKVRQVVWHGTEKGLLNSLSDKVRRHIAWASSSKDEFYASRKWIIKADTDKIGRASCRERV